MNKPPERPSTRPRVRSRTTASAPLGGGPGEITERSVTVRGLRLHTCRRHGAITPPLVLVHGIGGSLESWQPLLAQMPDRDVIMVDAPGAGRSQVPLLPIRVTTIADCVAGAVRALGIERADVLGFSLGGMVSQELARRHPALIRKLTLVGTSIGLGAWPGSWRAVWTLLSTRRYWSRRAAERQIPILAGGRTARDPVALNAILDGRELYPPTWLGFRYQLMSIIGWTSWHWVRKLPFPTLVLQGADDPIVRASNGQVLARRIPNARLEVVDGAGHLLLFDEPERAAPIIENFLDSSSKRGPKP